METACSLAVNIWGPGRWYAGTVKAYTDSIHQPQAVSTVGPAADTKPPCHRQLHPVTQHRLPRAALRQVLSKHAGQQAA